MSILTIGSISDGDLLPGVSGKVQVSIAGRWDGASVEFEKLIPNGRLVDWAQLSRPAKPGTAARPGVDHGEPVDEFRQPFVADEVRAMYFSGGAGYRVRVIPEDRGVRPPAPTPVLSLTINQD